MNELTTTYEWRQVPWRKLEVAVFKLQQRIYRASQANDRKLVAVHRHCHDQIHGGRRDQSYRERTYDKSRPA